MAKSPRFQQKSNKKKKTGIDINASIPAPLISNDERPLHFSFKHLDITYKKFHSSECTAEFHVALLHKLREFSSWTVEAFTDSNNKDRRHIIDFAETTEANGFALLNDEQLADSESWQFSLDKTSSWRVHGFILSDTFYIVWLDPNHRLYHDGIDKLTTVLHR